MIEKALEELYRENKAIGLVYKLHVQVTSKITGKTPEEVDAALRRAGVIAPANNRTDEKSSLK